MKLITYTLEPDGTIPAYVLDGGYYSTPNAGQSPQDWTLVGVAVDEAPGTVLADAAAVQAYLVSIGGESWVDEDEQPVDLAAAAANLIDLRNGTSVPFDLMQAAVDAALLAAVM